MASLSELHSEKGRQHTATLPQEKCAQGCACTHTACSPHQGRGSRSQTPHTCNGCQAEAKGCGCDRSGGKERPCREMKQRRSHLPALLPVWLCLRL